MNGRIELHPHVGMVPVHGSNGVIGTVEHDTGMKRIYWVFSEGAEKAGEQIGFLHPNGFVHFIVPNPPQELRDMVMAAIEAEGKPILKIGAPPGLEEE